LSFTLDDIAGISTTFNAINGDTGAVSAATDFDSATDCGIFDNGTESNEQICGVRVLLPIDIFFAAGTDSSNRAVTVTGMSSLEPGAFDPNPERRRLAIGGRDLQEGQQDASFSITFEIVVPENSGCFSMIVASTGAMAVAIAALLI
jgi:hypothetical protein